MTNAITVKDEVCFDTMLNDIETMQKMSKQLMQTKHYAAMGEPGIFAIVQKAKSLGINALEALNGGLYYVNGKVGMSTEMMASLIRQQGHSISKDPKSDNTICILHGRRKDTGDTWMVSFSMQDAQKAGLAKNMYDKYPAIMLYNRAMSTLARQLFPDVIKGAGYTLEELHEIKDSKSAPSMTVRVEPVEVEKITSEQAVELIEILDACEPDYQANVLSFIKKAPHNCVTLYDLPLSLYDRLRSSSIKKKEEAEAEAMMAVIIANSSPIPEKTEV
jgi:hypothetical protein